MVIDDLTMHYPAKLERWATRYKKVKVEYDEHYGCLLRRGWSICIAGSFVCQFEPSFADAMREAERHIHMWETDPTSPHYLGGDE